MTTIFSVITIATALVVAEEVAKPTTTKNVEPPAHQVVALYFHRTQRCATCKRIGALTEEAIVKGFAKEMKTKVVAFRLVDFQAQKNAELTGQFKIKGPTLVLTNAFDGEVLRSTSLPKVWQLVGKPEAFHACVRDGIATYLKQTKKEAESKE